MTALIAIGVIAVVGLVALLITTSQAEAKPRRARYHSPVRRDDDHQHEDFGAYLPKFDSSHDNHRSFD